MSSLIAFSSLCFCETFWPREEVTESQSSSGALCCHVSPYSLRQMISKTKEHGAVVSSSASRLFFPLPDSRYMFSWRVRLQKRIVLPSPPSSSCSRSPSLPRSSPSCALLPFSALPLNTGPGSHQINAVCRSAYISQGAGPGFPLTVGDSAFSIYTRLVNHLTPRYTQNCI